jgi:hypothetical protein
MATRLLAIIEAAVKAGQTPPPEILARFSVERDAAPMHSFSRPALTRVAALFFSVGIAAFLASAFVSEREQEQGFLFVAAIAGLLAILLSALIAFGRRLGA